MSESASAAPVHDEKTDLDRLFKPQAIAILGASGRASNPYARPLQYLVEHEFAGVVYPVNPNYDSLFGLRCYPTLDALPGAVDLVLMMVAADEAIRQMPAVARANAAAAIVFASGFGEAGVEGRRRQDELVRLARRHGVRLIGPNSQGILSIHERVIASFTAALDIGLPSPGNVAYIGQSGAVGGSILSLARERGLGIAHWVSTGNQADLDASEVACHLVEDPRVKVITLYLEASVKGAQFDYLTRRALELNKTILVLRSALSEAGARAAESHTGAITGSHAAFDAICSERGVVVAQDVDDFVSLAHGLSVLPRAAGRRVGIVSTSGGAASLAADQAVLADLIVEEFAAETRAELTKLVPEFGAVGNPIDATAEIFKTGESAAFADCCRIALRDPTVDALVVAVTMVTGELARSLAEQMCAVFKDATKPVVLVWMAAREQTAQARALLRQGGWPVLDSPRMAMQLVSALAKQPLKPTVRTPASADLHLAAAVGDLADGVITEHDASPLLAAAGVRQPSQLLLRNAHEARAAASTLNGQLVVKIQSPLVLHKSDRGGVYLDVSPQTLPELYDSLVEAFAVEGATNVLVQELAPAGPELLVGITAVESGLPPVLTVGFGGVTAEIYGDVVSRLAPVTALEATEMMTQLKGAPLLTGFRGEPRVSLEAAADAIAALSRLAIAAGERLVEVEVNPLRLTDGGAAAVALDFLMRLSTPLDLPDPLAEETQQ